MFNIFEFGIASVYMVRECERIVKNTSDAKGGFHALDLAEKAFWILVMHCNAIIHEKNFLTGKWWNIWNGQLELSYPYKHVNLLVRFVHIRLAIEDVFWLKYSAIESWSFGDIAPHVTDQHAGWR